MCRAAIRQDETLVATLPEVRCRLLSTQYSVLSTQYSLVHHSPAPLTTQNRTNNSIAHSAHHPPPPGSRPPGLRSCNSIDVMSCPPAAPCAIGATSGLQASCITSDSDVRVGTHTDTSTSTGLDTGSDCAHGQSRHASSLWPLASGLWPLMGS